MFPPKSGRQYLCAPAPSARAPGIEPNEIHPRQQSQWEYSCRKIRSRSHKCLIALHLWRHEHFSRLLRLRCRTVRSSILPRVRTVHSPGLFPQSSPDRSGSPPRGLPVQTGTDQRCRSCRCTLSLLPMCCRGNRSPPPSGTPSLGVHR